MKKTHVLSFVVACCAVAIAAVIFARLLRPPSTDTVLESDSLTESPPKLVKLSPAKSEASSIETAQIRERSITLTRTVPARFDYDHDRHVMIRVPAAGILQSVNYKPGDHVTSGSVVAVLQSPEIGAARSLLLQRISELDIAVARSDWHTTVQDGVTRLASTIRQGKTIDAIKKDLGDAVLGEFRSDLIVKYNAHLLAQQLSGSISEISQSGAISNRTVREREARVRETLAQLESSLEQAEFEASQARREAESASRAAKQAVMTARQKLINLTGQLIPDDFSSSPENDEKALALLQITSPIDGTIQQRSFSATERVDAGEELYIVADTSKLWVDADLRARDLETIAIRVGDPVVVFTGSGIDQSTTGHVHFLGREVDPLSGTLPLIVVVDNASGRYRPGQFARVEIPVGRTDDVIAVPEAAIIDVDGTPSVFVKTDDGFRAQPISLGPGNEEFVQATGGVRTGEEVVVQGTFLLKSELLLEGEE